MAIEGWASHREALREWLSAAIDVDQLDDDHLDDLLMGLPDLNDKLAVYDKAARSAAKGRR